MRRRPKAYTYAYRISNADGSILDKDAVGKMICRRQLYHLVNERLENSAVCFMLQPCSARARPQNTPGMTQQAQAPLGAAALTAVTRGAALLAAQKRPGRHRRGQAGPPRARALRRGR